MKLINLNVLNTNYLIVAKPSTCNGFLDVACSFFNCLELFFKEVIFLIDSLLKIVESLRLGLLLSEALFILLLLLCCLLSRRRFVEDFLFDSMYLVFEFFVLLLDRGSHELIILSLEKLCEDLDIDETSEDPIVC